MKLEKIKAIVFDVDDVLIRSTDREGSYYWSGSIEEDIGIRKNDLLEFSLEIWKDAVLGKADIKERVSSFLIKINASITPDEFISYWLDKDSLIDEQVMKMVQVLKGKYKLYLGTTQEKYRANYLWHNLGFKNDFLNIFASCYVGYEKPQLKYYNTLQKKINLYPETILMIDDREKNVTGAIECGWQGYHYLGYERAYQDIFSRLIDPL